MSSGLSGNDYLRRYIMLGEIVYPQSIVVSRFNVQTLAMVGSRVISNPETIELGLRLAGGIAMFVLRGESLLSRVTMQLLQSPDSHCNWAIVGVKYANVSKHCDADIMGCTSYFLECGEVDRYNGWYRVWLDMNGEFWEL